MSSTTKRFKQSDFPVLYRETTRFNDNDMYGHLNNAMYYAFYDTIVNKYYVHHGGMRLLQGQRGLVVHSDTKFLDIVHGYPFDIVLGLKVTKLGTSSVTFEIGVFQDDSETAKAVGTFVHVFVNEKTNRPERIEDELRNSLKKLIVENKPAKL